MTRIDSNLSIRYIPHRGGWITVHDATVVSDLPDPETDFRVGTVKGAWVPMEARAYPFPGLIVVAIDDGGDPPHPAFGCSARALTSDEARELAAWLLAAAHHIDIKENPND